MKSFLKKNSEPDRRIRLGEILLVIILTVVMILAWAGSLSRVLSDPGKVSYAGETVMTRDRTLEDYDEDCTVCDVTYFSGEDMLVLAYPYDEYAELDSDVITAYRYDTADGVRLFFNHPDPTVEQIRAIYRQTMTAVTRSTFNLAVSLSILILSLLVMLLFGAHFTAYEKIWFLSIMVLATIFAVLFPEENVNGINGILIMFLYLLDTFLNILCELLISKQSRYNFLVSVGVEITEIIICLALMYRFATMAVTLFFWLPIDIMSFINWTHHRDEDQQQLTAVRRLKGYQEVLVILAIVVWTVVVGYCLSGLDIATDFYHDEGLEKAIIYIDACASAVGVANGLFIFFRLREQWIAWYICATLEAIINVLSGQYVLLILKLGYYTNTTYGYIKWSRYIKTHTENSHSLF